MPKRTDISSILLIGSGPIVIGQACEFDYSGTQACRVLRDEGYRVILANSNPATIMTDPDFADATYVEPLDIEILTKIIEKERPDALLPTLGGQTALNLAMELVEAGVLDRYDVELIGADAEAIATALGGTTTKLPFGHHGGNHPVRRMRDGMVEITSQNHNFAVAEGSVERGEVTHVNLNDGVIEGIRALDVPAFSVQHHPEAGPGPHDSAYLFDDFAALMARTGADAGRNA